MKTSLMIGSTYSKDNEGYPVYYRMRDCRGNRILISSGIYTRVRFTGEKFPLSEADSQIKTEKVRKTLERIDKFIRMNRDIYGHDLKERINKHLGKQETYSVRPRKFTDFITEYSCEMKPSTARLYKLTADRINEFDKNARLTDIDVRWLTGFERFLKDNGTSVNGIAQKMRNIRAVFNYCIGEGFMCHYPFRGHKGYKIKEEMTMPNSLSAIDFAKLRDYPCDTWQRIYRDMFCLSFYLAGINVGDLLLCRGLKNGRLVFTRRKTDMVSHIHG